MQRRWWLLGLGVLIVGLAGAYVSWKISGERCFVLAGQVTCRVETAAPLVALTFDDGPTDIGLDGVLPELARRNAKATFFLIGEAAARRPDLTARLVAAGHELGNHSYTHQRMVGRTRGWYEREIALTEARLAAAGSRSGLFRPPYGKKFIGLPLAVDRAGLRMITWDVEDPVTRDAAAYARQVVSQARPGSIILMHPMYPSNATARAALPLILDGLERKGLQAVTVGQLLAAGPR